MYNAVTCDEILHLYCDIGSGYYWIAVGNDTLESSFNVTFYIKKLAELGGLPSFHHIVDFPLQLHFLVLE